MLIWLNGLFGKRDERGFTLIELLIVVLIVGILAAVATPIYLGYVKDAKTAEGKAIAGSLWTAVQSNAIGACGVASAVSTAWTKAGLSTTGHTTPDRWASDAGAATLTVDCTTGAYTASASPLFVVTGQSTDVDFAHIGLFYSSSTTPPSVLRCGDGAPPSPTSPIC